MLLLLALVSTFLVNPASGAAPESRKPEVAQAVYFDESPALHEIEPIFERKETPREHTLGRPSIQAGKPGGGTADGALQSSASTPLGATELLNFDGVGNGVYGFRPDAAPPDTNGVVGATQYVQWVNEEFAVFDKATGALLYGPVPGNTIWSGMGNGCATNNDGDPVVQYDKAANRWVMSQFSVSTTPYLECVAVSTTADATGSWYRYAFSYTDFPDYPKMGVWTDGYYVTFNMFRNGTTFSGGRVCAYDRTSMLSGAAASQICFQLSSYASMLPGDLDGSIAPPAGSPEFVMNFGTNALNLWKFRANWASPSSSTLTGPTSIPVATFTKACGGGACVPQPSTTNKLDSLGDRLMYRLAYRAFADGHESLLVSQSVSVPGTSSGQTGVRWYELRNPSGGTIGGGTPIVYQQSTYAPNDTSTYRWMPSLAMDKQGNIAIGYSASSSSLYPSVRYTGRLASDPLHTMRAEVTAVAGGGSQTGTLQRWGDYSAMTVDPVDDCTFWFTTEYLKASGSFNWNTRIVAFKFPGCQ